MGEDNTEQECYKIAWKGGDTRNEKSQKAEVPFWPLEMVESMEDPVGIPKPSAHYR